tara:strand:+ start:99 stop:428 length:330 start_codon:yes stop_codon:yes gene_type:complete
MSNNNQSITLPETDNDKKEKESVKKERKKNAIKLPPGLTQEMMKTYVVYYKEIYNKEKGLTREYFKVEKHPKLDKPWISSKSNKIPLLEKLKEANKVIDNLSKDKIDFN